jgi:hypothetical protein
MNCKIVMVTLVSSYGTIITTMISGAIARGYVLTFYMLVHGPCESPHLRGYLSGGIVVSSSSSYKDTG